jgi:hypothetical protein
MNQWMSEWLIEEWMSKRKKEETNEAVIFKPMSEWLNKEWMNKRKRKKDWMKQ